MMGFSPIQVKDIPRDDLPQILRHAQALNARERRVLGDAGQPRWLGTSVPWVPTNALDAHTARDLLAAGLLDLAPAHPGAYRLTHQGELIAGVLLQVAILPDHA
jgi:hypothetical protein